MRMTPVVPVLLMAVAAAGCTAADAPAGGAAGSGRAAGPAAAAPPGAVGIGASEARARGVLSAPYDAALRGPSLTTAGRTVMR